MALKLIWRRPARVFYGWWVVAAGSIIHGVGAGIHGYGFTVFFLPLSRELEVSRAAISLIVSLARAEGALEGPLAGYLIDRWGPRLMILVGGIMVGAGYILLAQVHSYLGVLLVYMGVISLGSNAGFFNAILAAANNWFVRRRSLVMGIIISASGAGSGIFVPLLAIAVHQWGWRTAAVLAGSAILLVVLSLSWVIRRSPESMGTYPDGIKPEASPGFASAQANPTQQRDYSVQEALRTRAFWVLVPATTLRLAVYGAILVHLIPILVWKGVEEQQAAFVAGIMFLLGIPTRLFFGWLGDHWHKNYLISLVLLVGMLALAILVYGQAPWQLWLFIALFAILEGPGPLNWALVGDLFGRRYFATIRGVMGLFMGIGSLTLPVLAGAVYDRTQSYRLILLAFIVLYGISALLFFWLRPPRKSYGY